MRSSLMATRVESLSFKNLFRDGRHLWFSTRYEIAESIDAAIDGIGAVSKEIPKAIEFPQSLLVPKNCVILRAVF